MATLKVVMRRRERLLASMIDVLSMTESYHMTHAKMCDYLYERVWNTAAYKSLPTWGKEYLAGYLKGRVDMLYRHNIEWRLYTHDGRWVKAVHYQPWSDIDLSVEGKSFWVGTDKQF